MNGPVAKSRKYPAHSNYQESGEKWLGQVPSHWDVIQIKHLSVVKRGASPRPIDDLKYFDEDGEYVWTRIADVTASDVYLTKAPQRLSDLGSSLSVKLEPESLFLSIAGTVGKPCITGMKACIHDGFVYFPELKIPSKFLFYVFAGEQAYKGLGKFGTQLNLNTDTVGGIKIGCTTNKELEAIVGFLDHETAKIDTLIEKQQQLIKLLKEKRQSVISHAVTKGLNPNAPMRDSGVEWLGDVPVHWVSCALKYCSQIVDCKHITAEFFDEGIPLASISEVKGWHVNLASAKLTNKKYYLDLIGGGRKPEPGDIIYSRNATVGEAALVTEGMHDFAMGQDVCLIRLDQSVLSEYILYVLKSGVISNQLDLAMVGSTFKRINVDDIRNFAVALPSYEGQVEIVKKLTQTLGKYDTLVVNAEKAISLMAERRTALISAAVTGKIDVRNWQAPETSNTNYKEVAA